MTRIMSETMIRIESRLIFMCNTINYRLNDESVLLFMYSIDKQRRMSVHNKRSKKKKKNQYFCTFLWS